MDSNLLFVLYFAQSPQLPFGCRQVLCGDLARGRLDGRPGRVASESLRRPFCSADHSQYARCGGELLSNRHRQSRQKEAGEMTSFLTVPKTPCGERLIPSKIPVTVVPQFTPRTEIMCFCCPPASSPIYHGARVTPAECPHS